MLHMQAYSCKHEVVDYILVQWTIMSVTVSRWGFKLMFGLRLGWSPHVCDIVIVK